MAGAIGTAVLGGAAVVFVGYAWLYYLRRETLYVDFEELKHHLESRRNKKATVNVQGTIVQEETRSVRSGNGEVTGVARRIIESQRRDLCTNMSVSFLLRDSETPAGSLGWIPMIRSSHIVEQNKSY